MCVQRVQRFMMAFMILLSVGLMHMGFFYEGSALLGFISFMIIVWAIFDFCPSIFLLKKIMPDCTFGANK